jgi:protein CpxP
MSKVKILSLLSIGLLITNLLLVCFIFFKKPMPSEHEGPKHLIIERLSFDKNQSKKYDGLIKWHRKEIENTNQNILGLKNQLYGSLAQDSSAIDKDSLINAIGQLQVKIESIHFKHFQDIKKLCKPNQIDAFNDLSKELAALFSKGKPPRKRK